MSKIKTFSKKVSEYNKDFENPIVLKDGRTLFTKNNGFDHFVRDGKGVETKITFEYYKKTQKHRINL